MGKYVEKTTKQKLGPTFMDKKDALIADDAVFVEEPTEWMPDLLCLVNNGAWAACGYAFDEAEMYRFLDSFRNGDKRHHVWFIYPNVKKVIDN